MVPFPTALVSEYLSSEDPADAKLAAVLYNLNGLNIAIAFNLLWRYAAKNGRLMGADVDMVTVTRITRQYRIGPVMYALSTTLAFFMPKSSVVMDLCLVMFFALPPPPLRKAQVASLAPSSN